MKITIYTLLIAFLFMGCQASGNDEEAAAGKMLDEARQLLAGKHYDAARDTILSLRQQRPTALTARRAAILTLDSIELLATQDSIAVYERLLQAARDSFQQMQPRLNGKTNDTYYAQQRRVMDMNLHFDELCAKGKFYRRKISIDAQPE